jgi:hypothetical protein
MCIATALSCSGMVLAGVYRATAKARPRSDGMRSGDLAPCLARTGLSSYISFGPTPMVS